MTKPAIRLLITDVDNTLYDWLGIWYSSFDALMDASSNISGVPREVLEQQARDIHRERGTPEYSHLLQELPALGYRRDDPEFIERYRPAIDAFRRARSESMVLYPGVFATLEAIRSFGCPIVAYTETSAFYTAVRLRWLGLDGVLDRVYSPPDHEFPEWLDRKVLRTRADEEYPLQLTAHRYTPVGHFKPDTSIVAAILDEYGVRAEDVLYVGDSLAKDIAMAQAAGVNDAYAAYGAGQRRAEYELLRRVSHWTDADIEREKGLLDRPAVHPSCTLHSFPELLDLFEFCAPHAAP